MKKKFDNNLFFQIKPKGNFVFIVFSLQLEYVLKKIIKINSKR